jgi:hypothetical protein
LSWKKFYNFRKNSKILKKLEKYWKKLRKMPEKIKNSKIQKKIEKLEKNKK